MASEAPCADYVATVLAPGSGNGATGRGSVRDDTSSSLQALKQALPLVLVAGIEKVTRTVISKEEVDRRPATTAALGEENMWASFPELDPKILKRKADKVARDKAEGEKKALAAGGKAAEAEEEGGKKEYAYQLHVEGYNLLNVMGVQGVRANSCKSNHITETAEVLGIEAARRCVSRPGLPLPRPPPTTTTTSTPPLRL